MRAGVQLLKHQQKSVDLALEKGHLCLFHGCGTGKTLSGLAIFEALRKREPNLRMLVVVSPKILLTKAWAKDIEQFTTLSYALFKDIKRIDDSLPDVVLVNYELMRSAKRFEVIKQMVKKYSFMCYCDESSKMKNPKSENFKHMVQLRDLFKHRFVASGTPASNGELGYWSQVSFVNPDTLGRSFYKFRNTYFYLAKTLKNGREIVADPLALRNPTVARGIMIQGFQYRIAKDMKAKLMKDIAPVSYLVQKKDALDLPKQLFVKRPFELSPEELKAYKEFAKTLVLEAKEGIVTVNNAISKLMKLRQLSSGFAYYDVVEQGEGIEAVMNRKVERTGNSRLNALEDLLDEVGDQPIVIWTVFDTEMEDVAKLLDKRGDKYVLFTGGLSLDEATRRADEFESGRAQFAICKPKCVSHGVTWVHCHTAIYYSFDFSWETMEQTQDRLHRKGQDKDCTYIYLLADKTQDERMYECVLNKRDSSQVAFDMLRALQESV